MIPLLSRIDRYVLRTFAASYVPVALAFVIVFVLSDGMARADRFARSGRPFLETVLAYYGAILPVVYVRFGAFLTLAAGMFAVVRLQRTNELLPMLAGGISMPRAVAPVFLAAGLLALIQAADAELLVPRIAPQVRAASRFAKLRDISPGILRDRAGNTLFATAYRTSNETLYWVTYRVRDEAGREARVVRADRARWLGAEGRAGRWLFEDGVVREVEVTAPTASARPGEPPPPPRYRQRTFGSKEDGEVIETSILPVDIESLTESVSLLSFSELREQDRRQRYLPKLRVQLHDRIAGPLAHLILLALGLPFVLRPDGGRGAGLFLGTLAMIAIAAGFFIATFISHALGGDGALSPVVAAWAPAVAFALGGIFALGRVPT